MRILFTLFLLISLTFPLFQVKSNSSADSAIEYVKDKMLDGNWGKIANEVIDFTEKALKKEKALNNSSFSTIKNSILTGYGVGFSSIGATVVTWNNYRFNRFEIVPLLPITIILIVLLQVICHNYFYKKRNAILSVINMLLALSIFGNCIGNDNYTGYLIGIVLFLIVQISYMIYFYWFPYNKVIVENDGNQSS